MELRYKSGTLGGGSGGASIPSGVILMWHGTEDTVPDGWAVCNGENGTPDFRGVFPLGASTEHPIGETGGSEQVTLTVAQMPEHSHIFTMVNNNTAGKAHPQGSSLESATAVKDTSSEGSSQPHPNMPPYRSILFIMKL